MPTEIPDSGRMSIYALGVSYKTAPVELRERLSFVGDQLAQGLSSLSPHHAPEGVILSTCHRTEIYAWAQEGQERDLIEFLAVSKRVSSQELTPVIYVYRDRAAVEHLFRVAVGLDSAILGESEVLGQVRAALREAQAVRAAGPVLTRLFQHALGTGKRARTETGIARQPVSLSSAAVILARQVLGDLRSRRALVVGAGEMSRKAIRHLSEQGVKELTLINRTREKADALARSAPIRVAGFEQLGEILTQVDLVIASTSATRPIIRFEEVQRALSARTDRKLMLIDLALPRNIDPALREFPGVSLWSIDDLSQRIEANLRVRAREIPKVEATLAQETTAFMEWYRSRQAILTITQLREHARAIQKSELTRALRRLGQLSDREIRIVEGLAESIVNKLLHQPTVRLKKEACRGNGALYTDALRTLFGLDPGKGHQDD